ncbi:hypothetical protein LTR62_003954 [Meristemomyces frigidus]|uniref:Uncharacterized protein n=1 Tax=Meristemomyces frigidus TaxID=1508187 RepID=A0AAN7YK85_9PEZI|nr:hypothetical protein LTR62_003954 [Meristemomyces frigidus]
MFATPLIVDIRYFNTWEEIASVARTLHTDRDPVILVCRHARRPRQRFRNLRWHQWRQRGINQAVWVIEEELRQTGDANVRDAFRRREDEVTPDLIARRLRQDDEAHRKSEDADASAILGSAGGEHNNDSPYNHFADNGLDLSDIDDEDQTHQDVLANAAPAPAAATSNAPTAIAPNPAAAVTRSPAMSAADNRSANNVRHEFPCPVQKCWVPTNAKLRRRTELVAHMREGHQIALDKTIGGPKDKSAYNRRQNKIVRDWLDVLGESWEGTIFEDGADEDA